MSKTMNILERYYTKKQLNLLKLNQPKIYSTMLRMLDDMRKETVKEMFIELEDYRSLSHEEKREIKKNIF